MRCVGFWHYGFGNVVVESRPGWDFLPRYAASISIARLAAAHARGAVLAGAKFQQHHNGILTAL